MLGNIRYVQGVVKRMRALEHHVHEASAARRAEFAGGVAYFNDDLRAVWDLNFLRLDRECADPAGEADRLQAHLYHRKVVIEDPALVAACGPALAERGFGQRGLVALTREPGGRLDVSVRPMGFDEARDLRRRIIDEQAPGRDPEVNRQVTEAGAHNDRAGGRLLVLFDGDVPVAHCVVYSLDGMAQIEDVATLEAYRHKGISTRLMHHALEYAAPDHDAVMILAEAQDWPLGWYRRLGFHDVEQRADFILMIAGS